MKEDLLQFETRLVRAETGKRLANYIIDIIIYYVVLLGLVMLLAFISPETLDALMGDSPYTDLIDRLLTLILYGLFSGLMEAALKGKSIGKYITKTKVVNEDGSPITWNTAFKRGFSKAVPFCAFSALGSPCMPWQDTWTNTLVIDEKESRL
jgi:uncharacterized RDD family membrane protein YckC